MLSSVRNDELSETRKANMSARAPSLILYPPRCFGLSYTYIERENMELHILVLTFPHVQTLCIEEFAPMQQNFIFLSTMNSIIGIMLAEHASRLPCVSRPDEC